MEALMAQLVSWEEQVARYEQRKDKDGERQKIPEDIRMSSIEALVPEELEKHLLLNAQRLTDYLKMREEVVMYVEARTGQNYTAANGKKNDPNAMIVDALDSKGKGKGSSGGRAGNGKGRKGNGVEA